jgi:PEP-CTERM motif
MDTFPVLPIPRGTPHRLTHKRRPNVSRIPHSGEATLLIGGVPSLSLDSGLAAFYFVSCDLFECDQLCQMVLKSKIPAMIRKSSMPRMTLYALLLVALVCTSPKTHAGPTVTLSSPQDLNALAVGAVVTIDVNLTGLPVGSDFIFNLNTSVLFPSTEFQTVPDLSNTSGLTTGFGGGFAFQFADQPAEFYGLSSLNAGKAIGIFAPPATAINENGLYYSFMLKAIAPGSGSILFDPTPGANQYAADDTGFNFAPLPTGGALSFVISSAVPEPSSLNLALVGLFASLGYVWCRRRRASISVGTAHP